MDFSITAVSSTRKTLSVNFSAADVAEALDTVVEDRRRTLVLPGFRKGKVPATVVEKRFGDELVGVATQNILDKALGDVLEKEKLYPLSGVNLDEAGTLKRGEAFTCSMSFDVLPDIAFPNYEGLAVNQNIPAVNEQDIDEVINYLRSEMAEMHDVTVARAPQDGDFVDVDYAGFDEKGEPVADVAGQHFSLVLGEKQAIDDFEALIKTLLPGEEKEGTVVFPTDYSHETLAGKNVTMRVKLNSLKERNLPELDDAFAQKAGGETIEKLRESISEHLVNNKKQAVRAEAMQSLLDGLLPQVEFDLPNALLESRVRRVMSDRLMRLQRQGETPDEAARTALEEEVRTQSVTDLKPQVFLMALARKENLEVTSQEVEMQIYSMSMRAGQEYQKVSEAYRKSGLTNEVHDRLLADKGMDLIYSKAVVTEVEAPAE